MDQLNETVVKEELTSEEVQQPTPDNEKNGTIGFWPFLGMIFLFAIPVIGFIAAIIFIFAFKNKSIKNFAGAQLTFIVVQTVTSFLVLILLISSVFGLILPAINNAFVTELENFSQVVSIAGDLASGNYSKALSHLVPSLTNVLGEEYQPFLEELSSGKYEDLFHQLKNDQYGSVLSDLKDGKYPDLTKTLDADSYDFIISELEKEANGMDSQLFEQIEELLP
ncbi:MAG: hypothetical protein IKU24_03710 [Clostridia bacterium]|nr:hypothetical protein [Clostridia bacterium]